MPETAGAICSTHWQCQKMPHTEVEIFFYSCPARRFRTVPKRAAQYTLLICRSFPHFGGISTQVRSMLIRKFSETMRAVFRFKEEWQGCPVTSPDIIHKYASALAAFLAMYSGYDFVHPLRTCSTSLTCQFQLIV